jgi:hypothetical protein
VVTKSLKREVWPEWSGPKLRYYLQNNQSKKGWKQYGSSCKEPAKQVEKPWVRSTTDTYKKIVKRKFQVNNTAVWLRKELNWDWLIIIVIKPESYKWTALSSVIVSTLKVIYFQIIAMTWVWSVPKKAYVFKLRFQ